MAARARTPEPADRARCRFALPPVAGRPRGWGPDPACLPLHLARIPYAPFCKADRLGRAADWSLSGAGPDAAAYPQGPNPDKLRRSNAAPATPAAAAAAAAATPSSSAPAVFAYQHAAEDDASFSVVDRSAPAPTRKSGADSGGRGSFGGRGGRGGAWGSSRGGFAAAAASAPAGGAAGAAGRGGFAARGTRGGFARGGFRGRGFGRFGDRQQQVVRDPSIKVGPTWEVVEELDFIRLSKLYSEYQEPTDIAVYGSVQYLDRSIERITTKSERPLRQIEKTFHNVTASDDPVIQDLARNADGPTIFATDVVLAALMTCTRSIYSFDIVVTKKDNKIFLDKRDNGPLDFVNVNENAFEPPSDTDKDNINCPKALAHEASHINRMFGQQVLHEAERVEFENSNPFAYGEPVAALASAAYRYRRWQLGDASLVVRTRLDAAVHQPGAGAQSESAPEGVATSSLPAKDTIYAVLRALNEFDSRSQGAGGAPDWRQKLDSQRGAVMATELKNNSNKLIRWTLETLLSGADQLRLGYVSRQAARDRKRHAILGFAQVKPHELMAQMNYNMGMGWGIVKVFTDLCMTKLVDGKYLLLRDPNKPVMKLYHVVAATQANLALLAPGLVAGLEDENDARDATI